jgi:hypothetical protein
MLDDFDWSVTTWEGSRRLQHREFYALPFRQKVQELEDMEEFGRYLAKLPAISPKDPPPTQAP